MTVYDEPVYEEPKRTQKMGKYERVLVPLMETPGSWAKIGEYKSADSAYQAALNLRSARYKIPTEPEKWEFVSEDLDVFARYLNGASPE